ncbi:uncharacterized protein F4822DRAFT_432919 [Hypoxylon trugodes]|uniref:uncharacterized protein n=1 Tax=Hypoxylon trugodes TaxID=326681 RepID=UPI00219C8CE1|nr:uncharacterized protein F4822DRAFT_432919 [Hypoxylon trugodes]KAI1384371.1 hypothetical protein F4822DRAFT_432919 [Hypoxylon trugodes]
MSPMAPFATAMLLLAGGIQAHFTVQYPEVVGVFDDDKEGTAPCGGYNPDITKVAITDFHVDGDYIATTLTHPEGDWLYRVTTDPGANGNWTKIFPIFKQDGAGKYCAPQVTVPQDFVGKKGYLGIVSKAVDGKLYQCAGVNFVKGKITAASQNCTNGTGVTATYTTDDALTAELGTPSPSSSEHATSGGVSSKGETYHVLGSMVGAGLMVVMGAFLVI